MNPDQDMHWVCDQEWLHFHSNHCPGLRMVRLLPAAKHDRLRAAVIALDERMARHDPDVAGSGMPRLRTRTHPFVARMQPVNMVDLVENIPHRAQPVVTEEMVERGARALYSLMPQAKRECFGDWEVAVPASARNNRERARAVLRAALEVTDDQ